MNIKRYRLSITTVLLSMSWISALFGLIVYVESLNQYFFVSRSLFVFPAFFWDFVNALSLSIDTSIRLMIIGVSLFIVLVVDFAITYTGSLRQQKRLIVEVILLLWFIFIVLLYDPSIYEIIYRNVLSYTSSRADFENIYRIQQLLHQFTAFINISLLCISAVIMISFYIRNRKYTFFSKDLKVIVIQLITVILCYFILFSSSPYFLKNVSVLSGTVRYQRINLGLFNLLYGLIPYLMMITLLLTVVTVYLQRQYEIINDNKILKVSRDVSMANSSSRVFTHSVKNQLIAILSDSELLLEKLRESDEIYPLAKSIQDTTNQTIKHLNDLRHFLDTLSAELKPMKIDKFLDDLKIHQYQTSLIQITTHLSSNDTCLIDPHLLNEAFVVMIKNAIESIGKNRGEIDLSAKRIDKFIEIRICDTGCGIDKINLEKIFDPFFSTKPSRSNWGVGLTFSQKIILAHHGRIEVESKLNVGTCFTIYLPIVDEG